MPDKDPMVASSPPNQREVFMQISKQLTGMSAEDVLGVGANLIINALRQTYSTKEAADKRFDELFGSTKGRLMEHFDSTGRKKGIFAYDQVIHMPRVDIR